MKNLIEKYLKDNNSYSPDFEKKYSLRDNNDGKGIFIDRWDFEAIKPEFSQKDIEDDKLDSLKKAKIDALKISRKTFQYSNIIFDDKIFINSKTAQNKFFNLSSIFTASDYPLEWRLADYNWIKLSKSECLELKKAILAKERLSYLQETNLFKKIIAAKNIEELSSINIEIIDIDMKNIDEINAMNIKSEQK